MQGQQDMQRAQDIDLEKDAVVFYKRKREYIRSKVLTPPVQGDNLVEIVFIDADENPTGVPMRTHKGNLYLAGDVEMAAGRKRRARKTRRKTAHKKRKTLSKRK